jgi:hypothetical protein
LSGSWCSVATSAIMHAYLLKKEDKEWGECGIAHVKVRFQTSTCQWAVKRTMTRHCSITNAPVEIVIIDFHRSYRREARTSRTYNNTHAAPWRVWMEGTWAGRGVAIDEWDCGWASE